MDLPSDSIGISDIEQYLRCARRFEFGMRRHSGAEPPESIDENNSYGQAFHEAVAYAEKEGASDDEAIQHAFNGQYGRWLGPEELESLRADLQLYRERDYTGVRSVAIESEMRVPLFRYRGRQIFFRFKVDRLYQRLDAPSVFISIDYKTSRHYRSPQEIYADRQQWSYNWGLHEYFPEMETLLQVYDALRFGVTPIPPKSPEQREQVREWLIRQATAILQDDELEPTLNDFCAYCPILPSCSVIGELSDYALAHIAGLAPPQKDGRRTVLDLDPSRLETYVEQLERVSKAKTILDRYDATVRNTLRQLPVDRRTELGYELRTTTVEDWSAEGLRAAHEILGDAFYQVVGLTKTAVERLPKDQKERVLALTERHQGAGTLRRRK